VAFGLDNFLKRHETTVYFVDYRTFFRRGAGDFAVGESTPRREKLKNIENRAFWRFFALHRLPGSV